MKIILVGSSLPRLPHQENHGSGGRFIGDVIRVRHKERTEPFIRILRRARPDIPILLVEDRSFSNAWIKKELLAEHQARRAALMATYEKLTSEGMTNLYYLKGDHLLGEDDEATVDGSHLSDLGMFRMAGALETVLRDILNIKNNE